MYTYYDKNGQVMSAADWAIRFEDREYKQVDLTTGLPEGARVSTIWLGIDHSWGEGSPLIFETMVFEGPSDQLQTRYSTLEEAKAGHAACVRALREGRDPIEEVDCG